VRVLYLNHTLRERGTFHRAFDIAREMARRGHEGVLWTASPHHWYRSVADTVSGVRIVETPSWHPVMGQDDGWGPLDLAWRIARVLTEPFDLIYAFAHPPTVYVPARLARLLRGKPLVADWCDAYRDGIFPLRDDIRRHLGLGGPRLMLQRAGERIERHLERRIVRLADRVTVISSALARDARNAGVAEERLLVLSGGADVAGSAPRDKAVCRAALARGEAESRTGILPVTRNAGIQPEGDRQDACPTFCGISDEPARGVSSGLFDGPGPFFGYVANYNPDERLFLAALARVFERLPGARLLSTAPPFAPAVVRESGVDPRRIVALGHQPQDRLPVVLGAADLLLLPLDDNSSNRHRWPNKIGDYLAAGRPVAACAVGDVAALFPESQAMRRWLEATAGDLDAELPPAERTAAAPRFARPIGLASRPDPGDYADAILALAQHPERWAAMGAAARRMAEERLDWRRLGDRLEPFLMGALRTATLSSGTEGRRS
jgi:glycosyltransferase involved in cell wall biosynthesis